MQVAPDLSAVRRARPKIKRQIPPSARIRDGFRTQSDPYLANRQDRLLRRRVTGSQRHDSTQARTLVEAWTDTPLSSLITDRAYERDAC